MSDLRQQLEQITGCPLRDGDYTVQIALATLAAVEVVLDTNPMVGAYQVIRDLRAELKQGAPPMSDPRPADPLANADRLDDIKASVRALEVAAGVAAPGADPRAAIAHRLRAVLRELPVGPWHVEELRVGAGYKDEARIYARNHLGVCKLTTGDGPDILRKRAESFVRLRDLAEQSMNAIAALHAEIARWKATVDACHDVAMERADEIARQNAEVARLTQERETIKRSHKAERDGWRQQIRQHPSGR